MLALKKREKKMVLKEEPFAAGEEWAYIVALWQQALPMCQHSTLIAIGSAAAATANYANNALKTQEISTLYHVGCVGYKSAMLCPDSH